MTSIFNEERKNIPCTLIEAGPCVVTQVRKPKKSRTGTEAVQLGYADKKETSTLPARHEAGHFKPKPELLPSV